MVRSDGTRSARFLSRSAAAACSPACAGAKKAARQGRPRYNKGRGKSSADQLARW
ncbi:hypothetical protein AX27061_5080 [Achromobacter xylosoxidans NBRC 15126 = ATCC 27061]|nr:hypothetical protein AX27061_5080 [Achromobacter xylosoxidans NBRC 15126 = ATCC 27061]